MKFIVDIPSNVDAVDYHDFGAMEAMLKKFGIRVSIKESGFDENSGRYLAEVIPHASMKQASEQEINPVKSK